MKKVCFVSLSRSDYTSLKPVIKASQEDSEIEVEVVAGGSHLLERFGKSIEKFEQDGIKVDKVVDFLDEKDDSELDMARAYGKAYPLFVEYFNESKPDFVFILGDRWEMLAAIHAASFLRIPIVHHSGGDITQGSLDNQTRYALTTQSHLHLVALEEHRERLLAMGEESWRVVTVGEPALTEIKNISNQVENIREELGLENEIEFVLATFHPTTFDSKPLDQQIDIFLGALDLIKEEIVLTAPNPDPGSRVFLERITNFSKNKNNIHLFENLGMRRYYAAMNEAEFMIGNSSSGIWEAPSFSLPVINMGERQRDRLRAENVIDVDLELAAIKEALERIRDEGFKKGLRDGMNPYVQENTNQLILASMKATRDRSSLLTKEFIDPLNKKKGIL